MIRRVLWLALFGLAGVALAAEGANPSAAPPKLDQKAALQFSESVVGKAVGDYTLFDRSGRPVRLSSYRGKPLLVSFIYTGCSQVCPVTTRFLAKAVKIEQDALGADSFAVVTVGFNAPMDSPQAMRDFAARQDIDLPNWEFLSTDAATAQSLTRNLGFSYAYSVMGFDHISQLTVIDAEGKVYAQVYGDNFALPLLGEPLRKLVGGTQTLQGGWEGFSSRIRLFCTVYDPETRVYRTDYSFFAGLFISLVMIYAIGAWIVREVRRAWCHSPKQPPTIDTVV